MYSEALFRRDPDHVILSYWIALGHAQRLGANYVPRGGSMVRVVCSLSKVSVICTWLCWATHLVQRTTNAFFAMLICPSKFLECIAQDLNPEIDPFVLLCGCVQCPLDARDRMGSLHFLQLPCLAGRLLQIDHLSPTGL